MAKPYKIPTKSQSKFLGPDLRKEIEYLSKSSFKWMALRSIDYTKPCSCAAIKNNTLDPQPMCSRCMKTGYLFTDYLVKAFTWKDVLGVLFNASPTTISTLRNNIVIRHHKVVNKRDYVLELELNPDTGIITQPFRIIRMFQIQDVWPLIGDSSRREFWKCSIEERNVDDGRPGHRGTGYRYTTNRDPGLL